mgnify:CR=1 FL=1
MIKFFFCKNRFKGIYVITILKNIFQKSSKKITPEKYFVHRKNVLGMLEKLLQDYSNLKIIYKTFMGIDLSNDPITEICFQVGFNNIANFNRRFYDVKSMTPSEYRRTSMDALYQRQFARPVFLPCSVNLLFSP